MLFTSGILIAFFCFAFYLIWDQFLKKDSRLSTGLQILRKKMTELESLSVQVSSQVSRQIFASQEKCRQLEEMIKKAELVCSSLEKQIQTANSYSVKQLKIVHKETPIKPPSTKDPVKEENLFQFGESPFKDVDFINSTSDKTPEL